MTAFLCSDKAVAEGFLSLSSVSSLHVVSLGISALWAARPTMTTTGLHCPTDSGLPCARVGGFSLKKVLGHEIVILLLW